MIFTLPRIQESIENRKEIRHANQIQTNKLIQVHGWIIIKKGSRQWGGEGSSNAHLSDIEGFRLHFFVPGRLFTPNQIKMEPKGPPNLFKCVPKLREIKQKLQIWKQAEACNFNKAKPYIMEAL